MPTLTVVVGANPGESGGVDEEAMKVAGSAPFFGGGFRPLFGVPGPGVKGVLLSLLENHEAVLVSMTGFCAPADIFSSFRLETIQDGNCPREE